MQPLTLKLPQVLRQFYAVIQDVNAATLPAHVALKDNVNMSVITVSTRGGGKMVKRARLWRHCRNFCVDISESIRLALQGCLCASAAEQSSSAGVLIQDNLQLLGGGFPVVFGCETRETGEIFSQEADGIMGLGKSAVSVVNQVSCKHSVSFVSGSRG